MSDTRERSPVEGWSHEEWLDRTREEALAEVKKKDAEIARLQDLLHDSKAKYLRLVAIMQVNPSARVAEVLHALRDEIGGAS